MRRSLNDSKLFQEIVMNGKLRDTIASIRKEDALDLSKLEEPLTTLEKRVNVVLKDYILRDLKSGKLKVICTNDKNRLPRYLNALGKRDVDGNIYYYSEISHYCKNIDKNGNVDIFVKDLLALLQNAYIIKLLNENWNGYALNSSLMIYGSKVYSRLLGKIMDKQYAINIDPVKRDVVHFLLAKFFVIGMCGVDETPDSEEMINNIALKSAIDPKFTMDTVNRYFNGFIDISYDDFTNILTFFDLLKKIDGLNKISIRSFVEQYVRMYGEGTLMSLDYLPSFISLCHAVSIGSNIHRTYLIESVCDKDINKYVSEFNRHIR